MNINSESLPATTARNDTLRIRVLVLMGVSGCGKSVVGEAVARLWKADFQDADRWHTPDAVAKMAGGHPLTDADRAPWLTRLRTGIIAATPPGGRTVLACSALRRRYRNILRSGQENVLFIYLAGTQELISRRMAARTDHYMPPMLLDSQFAALEEPGPDEAFSISIAQPLEAVVADVMRCLA